MKTFFLEDESATLALAKQLAQHLEMIQVIYLEGELGAGKTTFARGLINGLGHRGFVKSPSFTVVEPYLDTHKPVYHFDLYRLGSPCELEHLGIRDYIHAKHLCIFEWPERGGTAIPTADLIIRLSFERAGRMVHIIPASRHGESVCQRLS